MCDIFGVLLDKNLNETAIHFFQPIFVGIPKM